MKLALLVSLCVVLVTVYSADEELDLAKRTPVDKYYTYHLVCKDRRWSAEDLGVYYEKQPYSLRKHIDIELWKYRGIKHDVLRIAKQNSDALVKKYYYHYKVYPTCPTKIKYITGVKYGHDKCFVVSPQYIPVAVCPKHECYHCKEHKSGCFPDNFRRFKFWVYCRGRGFYLIFRDLPQCCSCLYYDECSDSPHQP